MVRAQWRALRSGELSPALLYFFLSVRSLCCLFNMLHESQPPPAISDVMPHQPPTRAPRTYSQRLRPLAPSYAVGAYVSSPSRTLATIRPTPLQTPVAADGSLREVLSIALATAVRSPRSASTHRVSLLPSHCDAALLVSAFGNGCAGPLR